MSDKLRYDAAKVFNVDVFDEHCCSPLFGHRDRANKMSQAGMGVNKKITGQPKKVRSMWQGVENMRKKWKTESL